MDPALNALLDPLHGAIRLVSRNASLAILQLTRVRSIHSFALLSVNNTVVTSMR